MKNEIFSALSEQRKKQEVERLVSCNEKMKNFGLMLSREDCRELALHREQSLKKHERVEFGEGITDKLIFAFCDSQYLSQDNYKETMERLQDIFYEFKNETRDKVSDDELIEFMREQYEEICFGDLDYLENTCLARSSMGIRRGGEQIMEQFEETDEETRWDQELYYQTLKNLF